MTKAEKRVAVAKDVLKQIAIKKLIPTHGNYGSHRFASDVDLESDARDALNSDKFQQCNACVLGGAMLSFVRLYDGLSVQELIRNDPHFTLEPLFGRKQLDAIEAAFEGWGEDEDEEGNQRSIYRPRLKDPTKRMESVMRNVIRNKGKFKPSAH